MKAKHRHELQTNELAHWLETSAERAAPYARTITAVVVAIAILAGAWWYISSSERRARTAASDSLVAAMQAGGAPEALQLTISQYRGSQPALIAQLVAGEQLLGRGLSLLYTNKPDGREAIMKAIDIFRATGESTQEPMLRAWAYFGLGRAYESLGNLPSAREEYNNVLKDQPEGALADDVRGRLESLDKPSIQEFYDWFAKQNPRPAPAEPSLGTPGMRPSFDLQGPSVGSEFAPGKGAEMQFPSSLDPTVPGPERPATEGSVVPELPGSDSTSTPAAPTGDQPTPGETFPAK